MTEFVILEAKAAMHHATSVRYRSLEFEELEPFPRNGLIIYTVRTGIQVEVKSAGAHLPLPAVVLICC